jgi:zinc transporter 1/2/3
LQLPTTRRLSFFIAICVHQFFEGLGLGSRIALLHWPVGQGWRKWLLAAIFGLITPFGMAVRRRHLHPAMTRPNC